MSRINVACDSCDRVHRVPRKYVGKQFACGGCDRTLLVEGRVLPTKRRRRKASGKRSPAAGRKRPSSQGKRSTGRQRWLIPTIAVMAFLGLGFVANGARKVFFEDIVASRPVFGEFDRSDQLLNQREVIFDGVQGRLDERELLTSFSGASEELAGVLKAIQQPADARTAIDSGQLRAALISWLNVSYELRVCKKKESRERRKKLLAQGYSDLVTTKPNYLDPFITLEDQRNIQRIHDQVKRIAADEELKRVVFAAETVPWPAMRKYAPVPLDWFELPLIE